MYTPASRVLAIIASLAAVASSADISAGICHPSLNGQNRVACMQRLQAAASSSAPPASSTPENAGTPPPATRGSTLDNLFPVPALAKWTTCSDDPQALPLSDDTLRPHHVLKALTYEYVQWAGKTALKIFYPKGSMNPGSDPKGGVSFYADGPDWLNMRTAKEITFGYSIWFEEGFEWQLGGKIPGVYGGEDDEGSVSCSGGSRSEACFSCRFMWREQAKGELYTYMPPSFTANDKLCTQPPYSECNPTYGASVARGSWFFTPGEWVQIVERVRLNDAGSGEDGGAQNGEVEVWANGVSVMHVSDLVLRRSDKGLIRGMMVQSFFGGSHPGFEAPKDSTVYIADWSAAITQYL